METAARRRARGGVTARGLRRSGRTRRSRPLAHGDGGAAGPARGASGALRASISRSPARRSSRPNRCWPRSGCAGGPTPWRRSSPAQPPRRHEVVAPLADAVAGGDLPQELFDGMIAARLFDAGDAPFDGLWTRCAPMSTPPPATSWNSPPAISAPRARRSPSCAASRAGQGSRPCSGLCRICEALGRAPLPPGADVAEIAREGLAEIAGRARRSRRRAARRRRRAAARLARRHPSPPRRRRPRMRPERRPRGLGIPLPRRPAAPRRDRPLVKARTC